MKVIDLILTLLLTVMFVGVIGSFFDLITAHEALMVLAVCGVPLTIAKNIIV